MVHDDEHQRRRHKKRRLLSFLPHGVSPDRYRYVLPNGHVTDDPAQALEVLRAGGEVQAPLRLEHARLLPLDDDGPRSTWEEF
jgi:hypothetical protein